MLTNLGISGIIAVIASMLIGLTLHEAMHAFVSHYLGDTTAKEEGRLSLNPLAHIDLLTTLLLPVGMILAGLPPIFIAKPVPTNPGNLRYGDYGMALVALAGPLTNLLLAFVAAIFLRLSGLTDIGQFAQGVQIFVQVNVLFFVFNMIPFPPLDGSRLLYAVAPEWLQRIMEQIERAGFVGLILFIVVLYAFIGPLIASISNAILNILL